MQLKIAKEPCQIVSGDVEGRRGEGVVWRFRHRCVAAEVKASQLESRLITRWFLLFYSQPL